MTNTKKINHLRYLCVLSGALPNDLINIKNGIIYSTEKDIKKSIQHSQTKPPMTRSFLRVLLLLFFVLNCSVNLKLSSDEKERQKIIDGLLQGNAMHNLNINEDEIKKMLSPSLFATASIINFLIIYSLFYTRKLTLQKQQEQKKNQTHSIWSTYKSFLNRFIWYEPTLEDDPIYNRIQAIGTPKTYKNTNDCLEHLYDQRFHKIFSQISNHKKSHKKTLSNEYCFNNPELCTLRKRILDIKQPLVYSSKKLSPNYFFRLDGSPRESVAEIAFAIAYHWKLSDSVLSSALHVSKSLQKTSKRFFGMYYSRNRHKTVKNK